MKLSIGYEKPQINGAIKIISFIFILFDVIPFPASSDLQAASNYLLFYSKKHQVDDNLSKLLKDTNHNHVSDTVNISLANSVWRLMHENALDYAQQRAALIRPTASRLFEDAQVSEPCRQALSGMIDHLARLDKWAVQMYNSFGDFPSEGLLEGSLNSMGSYHQCVNVEPNALIGQSQYCSFQYQPILPKRPRYHNILSSIESLANFTSKDDVFNHIAKKAQYFYYTRLRIALCLPSKCEKIDLDKLAQQVAVNTYIQYVGVSCLIKSEGFKPDGAQILALILLISFASISLLGTLAHAFNVKSFLVNRGKSSRNFNGSSVIRNDQDENSNDLIDHRKVKQSDSIEKGTNFSPMVKHPQQISLLGSKANQTACEPVARQVDNRDRGDGEGTRGAFPFSENTRLRLLSVINVLNNFSVIKNGSKLFDTSSSKPRGNVDLKNTNKPTEHGTEMERSSSGSFSGSEAGCSSSEQSSSSTESSEIKVNDISCVHGLRFWTISWIILAHTMQYTEWSGFGRAFEVESNITSFWLHPLLNATFSVDTFFLISGLLTTYVTWSITGGEYRRFNKFAFLISRYLRLTPQVLVVILLFIVFPLAGDGPYWRGLIQKQSDQCKQNWWISALYLQSFVRSDRICNLVTWWLSIEMYFHFMSIIIIIALLKSARKGFLVSIIVATIMLTISSYKHYSNHYPPNLLPTLLQRYEVWDSLVLKYFWSPYPHASAYVVGLMLGYVLSVKKRIRLNRSLVRWGWFAFTISYLTILFGTYWWNNNTPYSRELSTLYYNGSQVMWALSTGWAILACATGNGGWINDFLSAPIFVPLGRATYMTYLSHMLIVMSYPAKMNLLIEPTHTVFSYIFIANLFLSYALGIFLTLVYESPILHLQKLLVTNMAQKCIDDAENKHCKSKGSRTQIAEVA